MKKSDLEALQEDLLRWISEATATNAGTLAYLLKMAVLEAEILKKEAGEKQSSYTSSIPN